MKLIKLTAIIALSMFFYSCASVPEAVVDDTAKQEATAPEQDTQEEKADEEESDDSAEEQDMDSEDSENSADDSDSQEDNDNESDEPEDTEAANDKTVPVYEPIEDIQGYYESDPEPAFLVPSESKPKEEELEIPLEEEPSVVETLAPFENIESAEKETEASPSETAEQEKTEEETKVELVEKPVETPKVELKEEPKVEPQKNPVVIETPVVPVAVEEVSDIVADTEVETSELLSEEIEGQEENQQIAESRIIAVPSRSVSMKNRQYLDIVYPGSGWIYLGEEGGKSSMIYFGRKIGDKNTVFSLRSREEGNTILHFYKNDALTGKFIDDYLQVEIKGMNNTQEHAVAPSYAETVPEKPAKKYTAAVTPNDVIKSEKNSDQNDNDANVKTVITPVKTAAAAKAVENSPNYGTSRNMTSDSGSSAGSKKNSPKAPQQNTAYQDNEENNGTKTVIQNATSDSSSQTGKNSKVNSRTENSLDTAEPEKSTVISKEAIQNTEGMSADEILSKAEESFKAKKFQETLSYLDEFFKKATTRIDEGLFLQGQTFESNSSVRNIKSALDTYETIVRRYPQSIKWSKANERITYLRKFYFNIR